VVRGKVVGGPATGIPTSVQCQAAVAESRTIRFPASPKEKALSLVDKIGDRIVAGLSRSSGGAVSRHRHTVGPGEYRDARGAASRQWYNAC